VQSPEGMVPTGGGAYARPVAYSVASNAAMNPQFPSHMSGQIIRMPMIIRANQPNVGDTPVAGQNRVLSPGLTPQQTMMESQLAQRVRHFSELIKTCF